MLHGTFSCQSITGGWHRKAKEFVGRLGIETENLYESDAIGGGAITISPIQMAASYPLGNNGVYTDPHSITKLFIVMVKRLKTIHLSLKWL